MFRIRNRHAGWLMGTTYGTEAQAKEALANLPRGDYEVVAAVAQQEATATQSHACAFAACLTCGIKEAGE